MDIEVSWQKALQDEWGKSYIKKLFHYIDEERKCFRVYPTAPDVFQAFYQTPYDKVRVIIVGQDPYHQPKQAHGLSFSVPLGIKKPPSLRNIFKELEADLGVKTSICGSLSKWASRGVFLLNSILTVREGLPCSHAGYGWECFTDNVIKVLASRTAPLVFVLWGNAAKEKVGKFLSGSHPHLVLTAPHPSPLSAHRGFLGSKPFSKINQFLISCGQEPINWTIE